MKKLNKEIKIMLIILLIVAISFFIFSLMVLSTPPPDPERYAETEELYSDAEEYLKEELLSKSLITKNAKIDARGVEYSDDYITDSDGTIWNQGKVSVRVGENSLEIFLGVKEYVVTIEKSEYGDIRITGYERINNLISIVINMIFN